jgi:hypothetical protein
MGFTSMFDDEPEVIDSIKELREKKAFEKFVEENTFVVKRIHYDKMTNQQIEALFTKFYEVIIDDADKPYVVNYTNKKERAWYYTKIVLKNLNKRNLDRTIGYIHQATDGISQFSNQIGTDTSILTKPKKKKRNKKGGGFF